MTPSTSTPCLMGLIIAINTLACAGCSSEAQTDSQQTSQPAMKTRSESSASSASYRKAVGEKLQKIADAMYQHHDTLKTFPGAGIEYPKANTRGTPKYYLSWRVRLLPFLGEQELYDKFKLDEPWDSPHNKALIREMPEVYRTPHQTADDYKTVFVGAVYPEDMPNNGFQGRPDKPQELQRYLSGTVFDRLPMRGESKTIAWGAIGDHHEVTLKMQESALADAVDGLINTVMVFAVAPEQAVVWTQPADWIFDVENPRRGLPPDGFLAVFLDGSIHFIPHAKVDDEFVRRVFCTNDFERLKLPEK